MIPCWHRDCENPAVWVAQNKEGSLLMRCEEHSDTGHERYRLTPEASETALSTSLCMQSNCCMKRTPGYRYCKHHIDHWCKQSERPMCRRSDCDQDAVWLDHTAAGDSFLRCDSHSRNEHKRFKLEASDKSTEDRLMILEASVRWHGSVFDGLLKAMKEEEET